jgi:HlyD family type I secretion membrane fusion protein
MSDEKKKWASFLPAARPPDVGTVVGAFESETAAVILKTSPRNQHIIVYTLAIGFAFLLILSGIVKLDRVVVGTGKIVPVGGSLYVSPLDNGIVREVRVKPGDIVKKGQILATLDPTFTEADRRQLADKLESDNAVVARLEAELSGRPYRPTGQSKSDVLQGAIYDRRQAEYRSNLADFDARIRSARAQIRQFEQDESQYRKRVQLAEATEKLYTPLVEKGYVSNLQLMQAKDAQAEAMRLLSDAENQQASARQSLQALEAQRESFVQKWKSDAGAELVQSRNDASSARESLQKATRLNDLITLTAPADAVVLNVGKVSAGAIASNGAQTNNDPLFTLVPLDVSEEIDLKIPAGDIGFIKVGDSVEVKLDAYPFMQHGTLRAVIKTISEGSFTRDEETNDTSPYFRARLGVKEVSVRNVPTGFRLIPGMTVQGDILVGRRTILSYLMGSMVRTGSEAMREPF